MDSLSRLTQHTHKLYTSPAALLLPGRHHALQGQTVEISADGVQVVIDETLPLRVDCLVRLQIPEKPGHPHVVIAHARTQSCVFENRHGGFLVGLKFTSIPAASIETVKAFIDA
jgi:c-di-GMP-binding flagellar brake protein YcgR